MMYGMDERKLAQALENSKDDPEAWGEPQPQPSASTRKSEKRQRSVVVSVRLTPAELERIQAQATLVGRTVSGHLRCLALSTGQVASSAWPPARVASAPQMIIGWPYVEEASTGYVASSMIAVGV
jgi:hypothetical protein